MSADLSFSWSPCVLVWAMVMHPTLLGSYPQLMFIFHNPGAWGPEIRGPAQVGSGDASSQLYTRMFSWHPQEVEGVKDHSGVHFTKALMPSWGSICWEPPGCAQTVTRSRDERGNCKAALPLGVAPGAQFVPFLFMSYCYCAF